MRGPDRSIPVLVVGPDPGLEGECRAALDALPGVHAVVHAVAQADHAVDVARTRRPLLALVDLGMDAAAVAALARDLQAEVPGLIVAGLFQPDGQGAPALSSRDLILAVHARVQDFLRRPLSGAELRPLMERVATADRREDGGRIVSFISNKGGVGKSTLSVNVACMLAARAPGRVLLVDMSLQLGICALMLNLQPATSIVDAARQRTRLDETLLTELSVPHACGLRLLAAPADAMEASEVTDEAMARLLNLARRAFDVVVVDTFPMLDEVVMTVLDLSDLGFVVAQGTVPSVVGAARLLPVLEGIGFPASRQRVVVNHNYKPFAGQLTVPDIEVRLGRAVDHVVPYDKRCVVAMNTGEPISLRVSRRFGIGRRLVALADDVDSIAGPGERIDVAAGTRIGVGGAVPVEELR